MYYNKSDLPLNKEMLNFWNNNGYLIIEDFKTHKECDELINRSKELIVPRLLGIRRRCQQKNSM